MCKFRPVLVQVVSLIRWCCHGSRGGCIFFFKQKTAYELRISDWSSDVCSSDLAELQYRPASRYDGVADGGQALVRRTWLATQIYGAGVALSGGVQPGRRSGDVR